MTKKINLNFINYTDFKYDKKTIEKIIRILLNNKEVYNLSCLADKNFDKLEFDFVFCNDEFIHKINKEYRKKDCPTDVITFALFCDDNNSTVQKNINLGEIIISVDTANKQAKDNKHSLEKEICYLICHGILHLMGFDHLTEEEYNFMVNIQNAVMEKLNYD